MKEKNDYDNKKYKFSKFYIINNNRLFVTSNFDFVDNLKKCYFIKKLGSNVYPKIYLEVKKEDKKIMNFIGDYQSLMDFIVEYQNNLICITGFSKAGMGQFLRMLRNIKGIDIKPIKLNNNLLIGRYERHLIKKEQKLEELNERLEIIGEIDNAKQYMKVSNYVFGKERHNSRRRVLKLQRK